MTHFVNMTYDKALRSLLGENACRNNAQSQGLWISSQENMQQEYLLH